MLPKADFQVFTALFNHMDYKWCIIVVMCMNITVNTTIQYTHIIYYKIYMQTRNKIKFHKSWRMLHQSKTEDLHVNSILNLSSEWSVCLIFEHSKSNHVRRGRLTPPSPMVAGLCVACLVRFVLFGESSATLLDSEATRSVALSMADVGRLDLDDVPVTQIWIKKSCHLT